VFDYRDSVVFGHVLGVVALEKAGRPNA